MLLAPLAELGDYYPCRDKLFVLAGMIVEVVAGRALHHNQVVLGHIVSSRFSLPAGRTKLS